MKHWEIYVIAWLVSSLVCLFLYFSDKRSAKKGKMRTKEKTLLTATFLLGSLGALVGLYGLRHKTKHWYFVVAAWLSFAIHAAVLVWLIGQK